MYLDSIIDYKQIKGTAMGTPMAVNYANLFLNKFETELLMEFEKEFGVKPLVWMRYIDDIFFHLGCRRRFIEEIY